MGYKSKLKKQKKIASLFPETSTTFRDHHSGKDHIFSPEQMRVVAEMIGQARQEGQEQGRKKAALEFVRWIGTINEIKGIGEQRARAIADHFLAYGPGGSQVNEKDKQS